MTDKDQIDPVEAAHLSRYSPEGVNISISSFDPETGKVKHWPGVTGFTDEPIDEAIEVSNLAEKLTDEMLSGTFTITPSPRYETSTQEFLEALRKITKEKSRPMTAREAAAKAIGDWKERNKNTTPPAKKK